MVARNAFHYETQECPRILGPFNIGPRKISKVGRGDPVVYLGKDFEWAIGKKIMIQFIIIE